MAADCRDAHDPADCGTGFVAGTFRLWCTGERPVALTVALAGLTCAYRGPAPDAAAWMAEPALLLMPVLAELFIGSMMGLAVQVVLAALALAGRLMDVQIGFAIGSVFDPVSGASSNVLGSIAGVLGVMLFVVGDAHLQLARLVSQSIDVFSLGRLPPLDELLRPLLAAGSMFTLGLAFAAPLVAALLLTGIAVGVASRNMPQINVLLACGEALGINLLVQPQLLESPVGACRSAAWFWRTHELNSLADADAFGTITHKINGGFNGMDSRLKYWLRARRALVIS